MNKSKLELMSDVIESQARMKRASKSLAGIGELFDEAASSGNQHQAEKLRQMLHNELDNICDAKMAGFYAITEFEKLVDK